MWKDGKIAKLDNSPLGQIPESSKIKSSILSIAEVTTSITTSNGIEKNEKLFSTVTNNVTLPQGLSPAPSFSFAAKPTDWVQQGEMM